MARQNEYGQPIGDPLTRALPRPAPPRTAMHGRYCSLVPANPTHAQALFAAFAQAEDGHNWTYLPIEPFQNVNDCRTWLTMAAQSDDPLYFTVLDGNGVAIGWASYLRINPDDGVIEVGWINFSPAMQRSALSTEAMYLMMARMFDELGYRRYEWKCDALNAPSRKAAERLGFTYEGTFRQATHYKGRNRDTAWYAILDSEWPAQKARFQAWLQPANFDEDGRQKNPLLAK
ncbi:GNAT family protein [Alisedimentitalea sp. MJ-SS2]|uniref:GNAT family N-acetyltransferase n=1 Tax=Aliisedimentitalea sp. MJ-SS2 TaxID=3049795 RepID=UPI0029070092|nr:GNAT family protein [Alisedimentitalea sp. MJ-SS2]MDU8926896.1 GNAT family protein [Alisedimentitalea sp. MJ-SS2]